MKLNEHERPCREGISAKRKARELFRTWWRRQETEVDLERKYLIKCRMPLQRQMFSQEKDMNELEARLETLEDEVGK